MLTFLVSGIHLYTYILRVEIHLQNFSDTIEWICGARICIESNKKAKFTFCKSTLICGFILVHNNSNPTWTLIFKTCARQSWICQVNISNKISTFIFTIFHVFSPLFIFLWKKDIVWHCMGFKCVILFSNYMKICICRNTNWQKTPQEIVLFKVGFFIWKYKPVVILPVKFGLLHNEVRVTLQSLATSRGALPHCKERHCFPIALNESETTKCIFH